jgi:UDPglucose 6-dehydrogenase
MKIGIIGLGAVGQAIYDNYQKIGHTVATFDLKHSTPFECVVDSDGIFICVPTDILDDGTCDILAVDQSLSRLNAVGYQNLVIIKSTVLPGTTDRFCNKYPDLKICFIPEFLRQEHAIEDYLEQQQHLIVGCNSDDVFELVKNLHQDFSKEFFRITHTEAEFTKYFVNTFNSLRIVFANIFYESCQHLDADYNKVLSAATTRNVIAHDSYLKCSDQLRGFSGRCLPKDAQTFTEFLKQLNVHNTLFDAILNDNNTFIKK